MAEQDDLRSYIQGQIAATRTDANVERDRQAAGSLLPGWASTALQGATFGLSDEAIARGRSWFGTTPYDEALAQERAQVAQYRDRHGGRALAWELGGAALPALATRGRSLEPSVARVLPRAGTLAGSAARGALGGAAGGAAQGFGEGEGGFGSRAMHAAGSALMGGGLGAITRPALEAGGRLIGYLRERTGRHFGTGAERRAEETVVRDLERSGGLPEARLAVDEEAAARAAAARTGMPVQERTFAEVTGRQPVARLESLAQTPGAAADDIARTLEGRGQGRMARVQEGLNQVFGDVEGAHAARQAALAQRSGNATPLYDEAWRVARPIDQADLILLQRVPRAAINDAQQIAGMEGRRLSFRPEFDDDGFLRITRDTPTAEDLHRIKTGLDNFIERNIDSVTQRPTATAVGAMRVRDALRDRLDQLTLRADGTSAYAQARAAWAGPTANMAAQRLGARAPHMDAAELRDAVMRMSQGERDYFITGYMGQLREALGRVDQTGSANAVRAIFRNQNQRNAAEIAMQALNLSPEQAGRRFETLSRFLGNENAQQAVENQILRGSQTARRQAMMRDLAEPAALTLGFGAAGADPTGLDPTGGYLFGGALAAGRAGQRRLAATGAERLSNLVGRTLMESDPVRQAQIMRALQARQAAMARPGVPGWGVAPQAAAQMAGQVAAEPPPPVAPPPRQPGLLW